MRAPVECRRVAPPWQRAIRAEAPQSPRSTSVRSKRRTLGEAVPLVDELEQELQRVAVVLEAERPAKPVP